MSEELTHEHMRELAKRVRAALPAQLGYALVIWPMGTPEDCGYFSNSHRVEVRAALESLLGAVRDKEEQK